MTKKNFLSRTLQSLYQVRSFFRHLEIYFTLHMDTEKGQYSLILSHLPPLPKLIEILPKNRFTDKYLIIYFGAHSDLSYDDLSRAGIAFEALPFENQTLCCLQLNSEQIDKLMKLSITGHDWWCFTQTKKPTVEILHKIGIIESPSAFKRKKPDLHEEILINYFMDPSFHGFSPDDFGILIQELFIGGFEQIFRELKNKPAAIMQLRALNVFSIAFPTLVAQDDSLPMSAVNMQSFHLRGGKHPSIKRVNWFTGQRERLRWEKNDWGSLQALETSALGSMLEVVSQYLTPLFLVPIALIVIPITLVLWPFIALLRWVMNKQEEN